MALLAGPRRGLAPKPVAAVAAMVSTARCWPLRQRCVVCHGEALAQRRGSTAPELWSNTAQIHQQVVVQRVMPLNNATGLTMTTSAP